MFIFKKVLFKLMELGLGLRPCFSLQTKNPIFINFALDEKEADLVRQGLPPGFSLEPIAFTEGASSRYWLSYNLYEIEYPKKELATLRKVRCEINTFVRDGMGRVGIYVFCGSPFVSKEEKWGVFQVIADLAERLVIWIYGVGKLLSFQYELSSTSLKVRLSDGPYRLYYEGTFLAETKARLSPTYSRFNDLSFFNKGKTFDCVNTNSEFPLAEFQVLPEKELTRFQISGPFLNRPPNEVLFHIGRISYLVCALNKTPKASFSPVLELSKKVPCPN